MPAVTTEASRGLQFADNLLMFDGIRRGCLQRKLLQSLTYGDPAEDATRLNIPFNINRLIRGLQWTSGMGLHRSARLPIPQAAPGLPRGCIAQLPIGSCAR